MQIIQLYLTRLAENYHHSTSNELSNTKEATITENIGKNKNHFLFCFYEKSEKKFASEFINYSRNRVHEILVN